MTKIWAHRGASGEAPENTIEAFQLALEQGADGFELDVQRTADGVLVVCHDETVDRTSDGSGAIVDLSWAQLQEFDFSAGKSGFADVRIPTLAQVLELVVGTSAVVNIELKNSIERYPGMEAEVADLVARMGLDRQMRMGLDRQIWYSSFNHLSLVELVRLGVTGGLGALYIEQLVRPWDYVSGFGASALHPAAYTVTPELVEASHRVGVRVHPWTIDDPETLRSLAAAGVDAVITNLPALAREVIAD